ncbi:hypothetical protein ABSL23_00550 (plasmid) [Halobacterium sp. NMX12-1]|uniref:Uncharacterized protein n=1 Tax=Halobacterium sp. NMX12-1 TaxID=3166650 RepID=A0AAU8C8I4_9EURY
MSFDCSRRQSMMAAGGLLFGAGCLSWGSPSQGIIEIETTQSDYSVPIEVTSADETVLDETYSVSPDNPIYASFTLERETDYDVELEFEPAVRTVDVRESAAERGWTAESGDVHGAVGFSSSDQVYTVSIDDREVAVIEYETANAV